MSERLVMRGWRTALADIIHLALLLLLPNLFLDVPLPYNVSIHFKPINSSKDKAAKTI